MASFLKNILVLVAISTNVLALAPSRTIVSTNHRTATLTKAPVPTAGGLFGVPRKGTAIKAVETDLVSSIVPTVLYTGAAVLAIATQGNIGSATKKEEQKTVKNDSPAVESGESTGTVETKAEPAPPAPAPASPAPAPAPAPVAEDITALKMQVASTVESQKVMEDRLKESSEALTSESPAPADASSADDGESTEVAAPVEEEKKLGPIRSFLSLLWKIIRKILKPWKKWSEL